MFTLKTVKRKVLYMPVIRSIKFKTADNTLKNLKFGVSADPVIQPPKIL